MAAPLVNSHAFSSEQCEHFLFNTGENLHKAFRLMNLFTLFIEFALKILHILLSCIFVRSFRGYHREFPSLQMFCVGHKVGRLSSYTIYLII